MSHEDAATGALSVPVSASIAHLKVNGTAMVASLAASSSTIDSATRSFRSRRSAGQIYGRRPHTTVNSEPPSADTSRFNASLDRKWGSVIIRPAAAAAGRTAGLTPYRGFLDRNH